jgi:nucleotide-binding universal stress UspA family protein
VKLFSHILCATDFSACAERGVVMALRLSADLGAKLTLLHADDILWMTMGQLAPLNDLKKEGREHIEKNLRELGVRHDLARANIEILEGKVPEQIETRVSTSGADLVVIGSHGPQGWERRHLGSVAEKLLHRVRVPLLVVPPRTKPGDQSSGRGISKSTAPFLKKLLLAVDFGSTNAQTVTTAVELARLYDSKLFILHAAPPVRELFPGSGAFFSKAELTDLEERMEGANTRAMNEVLTDSVKKEIEPEFMIREGAAYEVIASTAREKAVDLVILGADGGNERGWLGSTAHKVLKMGVCPSLIVRP